MTKKVLCFLTFIIFSICLKSMDLVNASSYSNHHLLKNQSPSIDFPTILFILFGILLLTFLIYLIRKWLIRNNMIGLVYRIFVSTLIFIFIFLIGGSLSLCFILIPNELIMWICIAISFILYAIFAFYFIRDLNRGYTNGVMTEKEIIKGTKAANELKKKALPNTPENKELLEDLYHLYVDIQNAWMNFDYDKMRNLVTDELFNTYKNQLEMLEFKVQRNIMHSFELKDCSLLSINEENGITSIQMLLTTSFYGYTVHRKKKKKKKKAALKGSKKKRIEMTYLLTFISMEGGRRIEKCPNCGASIEEGKTLCEYCHSNVSTNTGGMRLSKKSTLVQKWEENIYK